MMGLSRAEQRAISDSTECLRVLQLTDPHVFADRDAELRGLKTWRSLSNVVDHYERGDWRADLVFLTGDLVQDDSRGAYRNLRLVVDRLGLPVHVVPGNHDVPELIREELDGYGYCDRVRGADWTLIGLSTHAPGRVYGVIAAQELARLAGVLAEVETSAAALFLHHPPVTLDSPWMDAIGLENRQSLFELVERFPVVRVIVFGHAHQAFDKHEDAIRIVGTPSTGRQFRPRTDEFALDDRPPAYRRLEFRPNGRFDTEVIWIGDA